MEHIAACFFEPSSKRVVYLNTETGSLTETLLPFPDIGYIAEYTLSLTANGDAVLIILTPLGADFDGRCRMFMTHLSFADFG